MNELVDLVYTSREHWGTDDRGAPSPVRKAFADALRQRYPRIAADLADRNSTESRFQLRVNSDTKDGAVPYAALIPPEQERSGPYGGMSFVMFPADDAGKPALIAMGVGTNGLAPDEQILGRPGHGRKCTAIAAWLNQRDLGSAWAKRDPVRIDLDLPKATKAALESWSGACEKYGKVLYSTFSPPEIDNVANRALVLDALVAFVDLFFDERRIEAKREFAQQSERVRREWLSRALPDTTESQVVDLLRNRRFVVLEGPPGTGKTRMALSILKDRYQGRGKIIQFHPGTTYESFIGGLAPERGGTLGFTFSPTPGHLMQAVREAAEDPSRRYLLMIDEINRADLAKVLGEAIYLFEPGETQREVALAHEFAGFGRKLQLPPNLDVLGTMNSADRSIAILDVAVRRRFAFVPLWPQLNVVEKHSGTRLRDKFNDLVLTFVEHATADAFALLPGHSYFLGRDEDASALLRTSLRPLLEEYLAQGYVAGFADEIRAYIDRLESDSG